MIIFYQLLFISVITLILYYFFVTKVQYQKIEDKVSQWISNTYNHSYKNNNYLSDTFLLLLRFKNDYDFRALINFMQKHKDSKSSSNILEFYDLLITSKSKSFSNIKLAHYICTIIVVLIFALNNYFVVTTLMTGKTYPIMPLIASIHLVGNSFFIFMFVSFIESFKNYKKKLYCHTSMDDYYKIRSLYYHLMDKDYDSKLYNLFTEIGDYYYSNRKGIEYIHQETSNYLEIIILYILKGNLDNLNNLTSLYLNKLKNHYHSELISKTESSHVDELIKIKESYF